MQPRFNDRYGRVAVTVVVVAAANLAASAQSSSPSFILQQSTLSISGEATTSSSFRLTASVGQELTVGTSSSTEIVLQSGFFSFVGSGLVPVVLTVGKNNANPGNVDLSWSGNNPPYDVYQSTVCSDVFGSFLDTAPNNGLPDVNPPAVTLVCYNVLATAPGPAPPPTAP